MAAIYKPCAIKFHRIPASGETGRGILRMQLWVLLNTWDLCAVIPHLGRRGSKNVRDSERKKRSVRAGRMQGQDFGASKSDWIPKTLACGKANDVPI